MPLDDTGGREKTKVTRDAFLYMDSRGDPDKFAQCESCRFFMPGLKKCAPMDGEHVLKEWSCGGYAFGTPTDNQPITKSWTPKEAGLVQRAVRCQHCRFRDGHSKCGLFESLNKKDPETFNLDTSIDFYGCCNAQEPIEHHAGGGRVGYAEGGDDSTADQPGIKWPAGFSPTEAPAAIKWPEGFSADQPAAPAEPEDTGLSGALMSGLSRGIRGPVTTAQVLAGERPEAEPPRKTIAEQPVELSDLVHPYRLGEKLLYQTAESAPALGMGIAAGAAATPGGPFAQLGAGALAYGATSAVQQLGPLFADELSKNAKDPEAAWNRALGKAAETGAFGSLGWAAFGVAPFASTVKNLLFQAFVAQPGLNVAEQATQNVQEGKPATENLGQAYAQGVAGTAIPILGVEGARYVGHRIAGRAEAQAEGAPPETARPAADTTPPPAAPDVGATVGVTQGDAGVQPMTVTGYSPDHKFVRLTDADGVADMMTTQNFLSRVAELPPAPEEVLAARPAQPEEAPQPTAAPEALPEEPAPAPVPAAAEPTVSPEVADEQARHALVEQAATATETIEPHAEDLGDHLDDLFRAPEGTPPGTPPEAAPPEAAPIIEALKADQAELAQTAAAAAPTPERVSEVASPRPPEELAPPPARDEPAPMAEIPPSPPTIPPSPEPISQASATGSPEAFTLGPSGATAQLYAGLFDALQKGRDTFAGVRDPVIARAKPFFDAGIIKSSDDLRELVQAGWDPARAGLTSAAAPAEPALEPAVRGLAEGEPRAPGAFRDTMAEYTPAEQGGLAQHMAARDYVMSAGNLTGNEHMVAYDAATGRVEHVGTGEAPDNIGTLAPELSSRLADPSAAVVLHHNHPENTALSLTDVSLLFAPGMHTIAAHGPDGSMSAASLTPQTRTWLDTLSPKEQFAQWTGVAWTAKNAIESKIIPLVREGRLTLDAANQIYADLGNRGLAAAGLIDYVSSHESPLDKVSTVRLVAAARDAALEEAARLNVPIEDGKNGIRLVRSAGTVLPDAGMASVSDAAERYQAERGPPVITGGDQGSRAAVAAPAGIEGYRLAEETPDLSERAAEEATEQAGDPGHEGFFGRLLKNLGAAPDSPGAKWHEFNAINKNFTTFLTKGRIDPLSAPKVDAEMQKFRDAASFLHSYKEGLASWQGKSPELWKKLFSAMELLTLQGREVPLDGRAVVVENTGHPLAALSKLGDIISLETPEEIQMFTDYRRTMDKVWQDVVAETARRFGWEGDPTSAAMLKAAEAASPRDRGSLLRAARIVAAIEYQARTAYLPLMRSGDYFLRVTPKAGTEDKPGILGWGGDGFPPTVSFHLIDARTPGERFFGGMREGTPATAEKAMADLRERFPVEEYDIEHGFLNKPEETIRDLNIPAIEKLMMLTGNDIRGLMADRLVRTGMSRDDARDAVQGDYDKLVNSVLDEITEAKIIGPRRQRQGVPGYDADFASSTGKYFNWLSSHVSNIKNGQAIDEANAMIAQHPDPRTRAYFRDWDRRQEDYGDQLAGPLMKMRQGAFYWFLGANLASTVKILLHGPLLGIPTLTTGLGALGRGRAAADYLNAAKDLMKGISLDGHGANFDLSRGARTPAERALVADAEARGHLHPHGADELAAVARQGEEALTPQQRFNRRIFDIWGSNISAADRLARGTMLLSSYRIADREGMDTINRVWDRDELWRTTPEKTPEAFAKFMVDRSTGVAGNINRMPVLRSQLGGMIGQFRNYEILWLSNLYNMSTRMGPEGKVTAALMLGSLGLLGGAVAMPFIQDAEKAAEFVYGMIMGIEPDLQAKLRDAFGATQSDKETGETVLHGIRPFGIDLGTIGFGDLISRQMQSPLDYAGAAVSAVVGGPYRAWEKYNSEQGTLGAVRELMPSAVKNMISAMYPETGLASAKTGSMALSPQQLTTADRVKRGLGFQPEVVARRQEETHERMQAVQSYKDGLKLAETRIANMVARGVDPTSAMTSAQELLAQGEKAGVFSPFEAQNYHRVLAAMIAQRTHPEIPTKAEARYRAAQSAQP